MCNCKGTGEGPTDGGGDREAGGGDFAGGDGEAGGGEALGQQEQSCLGLSG